AWGYSLALWVMPLAFILLVEAYVPSNLKRLTAHPMLWGVTLWAGLHLLANGDTASLLLFGAFGLYSLYAMWSQSQRGVKPAETMRPVSRDIAVVAIGLGVYAAALYAHRWLSGVPLV
ncbi:MAG: NnrU family protein, partial [Longimicrobiales bacterium]